MPVFVRSSSAALAACALALALTGCPGPSDPPKPPAPPDAPASLTATPFNAAVALSWTASARAESYKVYQSATSGQPTTAMTLLASGITGTSFNAGATNDVLLYYRVTAVNSGGESAGSAEASAMATGTLLPAKPVGLTATPGNQSVTLAWDDVPGATSYVVYRSTTPGVTTAGTAFTTATSGYVNTGLTNGVAYYYAVAARNGVDESALSAEVMATPVVPPSPPYIDATVVMMPASVGYGSYEVQVCADSICDMPITNAVVAVGGTTLAYDGIDTYEGSPTSSIAGSEIQLTVTIPPGAPVAAGTYTAHGTMYTNGPGLTSPTQGATWQASQPHTFTWTHASPTAASTYAVSAFCLAPFDLFFGFAPTTESSYAVAANALSAGSWTAIVQIVSNARIAIPNTLSGSGLSLAAASDYVSFTVQ